MNVRIEKTVNFYETILLWWSKHSILVKGDKIPFPPVHLSLLPENVFIVSNEGQDLYSIFFYNTDSALAYLAYPTSNKSVPKEKREGALEFLMKGVESYAIEQGYYLTYTTSPVIQVQIALLNSGYVEGDMQVNQYFKELR